MLQILDQLYARSRAPKRQSQAIICRSQKLAGALHCRARPINSSTRARACKHPSMRTRTRTRARTPAGRHASARSPALTDARARPRPCLRKTCAQITPTRRPPAPPAARPARPARPPAHLGRELSLEFGAADGREEGCLRRRPTASAARCQMDGAADDRRRSVRVSADPAAMA